MDIERNKPRTIHPHPTGTPPSPTPEPFEGIHVEISKTPTVPRSSLTSTSASAEESTSLTEHGVSSEESVLTLSDTLGVILGFVPSNHLLSLREVTKLFRDIINISGRISLQCPIDKLDDLSKKLSAARALEAKMEQPLASQGLLNISLTNIKTAKDAQTLTNFLKDPSNKPFLERIGAISFDDINNSNAKQIQELLNFITENADQFPQLTTLSFKDIRSNRPFTFPKLPDNLVSLSFGNILGDITFPEFPKNLTSLSFGNIRKNLTLLEFPKNLVSLSFGFIGVPTELPEFPENLTSLSCRSVISDFTLPTLRSTNLISLSLGHVYQGEQPFILPEFPETLTSLSFRNISGNLIFPTSLPNSLEEFSIGSVNRPFEIPNPPANLTSFHHSKPAGWGESLTEFKTGVDENRLRKLNRSKPEKRKAESTGPETKKRRIGPNGSDSQSTAPGMDLS